MKDCLLLTTIHGSPILIGSAGLTIEPEPQAPDRTPGSIVILPNNNREKPKIIVQQAFTDICRALSRAGHLIEVVPDENGAAITKRNLDQIMANMSDERRGQVESRVERLRQARAEESATIKHAMEETQDDISSVLLSDSAAAMIVPSDPDKPAAPPKKRGKK